MHCGASDKTCWCKALPVLARSAYGQGAGCYCAACLQDQLDAGVVLYGIDNCDTVKKARQWFTAQGIDHAFWDYKTYGVPPEKLSHWLAVLGWERVLNTRGTAWRALPDEVQAAVVDAASAQSVLLLHASAIKRPIVAWGNTYGGAVTVGFEAALWQQQLKISGV